MITLEADVLMANYLFYNPDKSIDIPTFKRIRGKIWEKVEKDIYFDISSNAIIAAVQTNSHLFQWEQSTRIGLPVIRATDSNKYYTEKYLGDMNCRLPNEVINALTSACNEN